MSEANLKEGDVVIRSVMETDIIGPRMTVAKIDSLMPYQTSRKVHCIWFDKEQKVRRLSFWECQLLIVPADETT